MQPQLPVVVCLLELLGDAHLERAALETILCIVFVKTVNIQRRDPWHVGQTELAAYSMDLVASVAGGAAAIVGDLPRVITGRTDFEQQAHVLPERQELADAPVEREIVAGSHVEALFLDPP